MENYKMQKIKNFCGNKVDALYQYSDVFTILHRPEMLNLRAYGPEDMEVKDVIYWHFIKVRDGDPFIAKMRNLLKYNQIIDFD